MTLAEFMEIEDFTDAALARVIGLERSTVTRLRRGQSKPSLRVLLALETLSKGKVRASDFVEAA